MLEQRVAGEVKRVLTNYYSMHSYFPWADVITSAASYSANQGTNRGWLPDDPYTYDSPYYWPTGSSGFAPWFFANQWNTLIYYSVGKYSNANAADCTSCGSSNSLNVDGALGTKALFFMPGTYSGTRAIDNLSEYLEDAQNNDNSNDYYVTPASQDIDRDRLYRYSSSNWIP